MKRFKYVEVGGKLVLGFSILIILMGIIGFLGFQSTKNIQMNLEEIFAVRLPSIDYLIETDRDLQRLLVAERSMLFADPSSNEFKEFLKEYEAPLRQSEDRWQKFKALAVTSEEKAGIERYEKARKDWEVLSKKVVDNRKGDARGGATEALDISLGVAKEKFEEMRRNLEELEGINLKNAQMANEAASATYRRTIFILFLIIGAGLVLGVFLMLVIRRGIVRPLRSVIQGLTASSGQVSSASFQVSSASQSLAEGASEQAAGLEETSSSIEEMGFKTKQNADNATQANGMMGETSRVVDEANRSMTELIDSMKEISSASEETAKIIKTVDEIAFQTNLLALNAAVEAARAGEAGAGFAVVADEVRNLAMRAADAARNTADLIEGTVKKIKSGSEVVSKTNEAFAKVATGAKKIGKLIEEISVASRDQARGIEQLNKAMAEIDKIVQKNAANAEESASAAERLNAQAEQMKGFVKELVAVVGGNGKGNGLNHSPASGVRSSEAHKPYPFDISAGRQFDGLIKKPGEMEMRNGKMKKVRPEQVIPMEEKDFKEF